VHSELLLRGSGMNFHLTSGSHQHWRLLKSILKRFYSVNTTVKSLNNNCSAFMYTNSVFLTVF